MSGKAPSEVRISLLPLEEARAAGVKAEIVEAMAELSIFRVLLHHPELARSVNRMLVGLLFRGKLSARLRELVIMRIGWVTGSSYEWTQHWRVAKGLGIPEEDLLAVREWRTAACFDAADRAALAATDETLAGRAISSETWKLCEEHVGGREELLELVAAIGLWSMVSSVLRNLRIPLEEGVMAWPPDGRVPPAAQERNES